MTFVVAILSLLVAWGQLLWQLHYSWHPESSYSYGWLVAPMAVFLIWQRLKVSGPVSGPSLGGNRAALWWIPLLCGLGVFVISALLMSVNPFWRLPLWGGGLSLVLATLTLAGLLGGRKMAVSLVMPLLFTLTMVPWPMFVEKRIIFELTGMITNLVVEALHLMEHPAEAFGNIVRIGSVTVGVEEACSGIKSMQALFMMGLFVGEFWMLKTGGRIWLVVLSVVITFVFNFARALTLSLLVLHGGDALFDEWHDTVGYIALGVGMLTLFLVAARLQSEPNSFESLPTETAFRRKMPFCAEAALLIFAISPMILGRIWFDELDPNEVPPMGWTYDENRAELPASYMLREESVPVKVAEILGFDYGTRMIIEGKANDVVEGWYYGYSGTDKGDSLDAFAHSPNVCMTSAGAEMIGEGRDLNVDVGLFEMPFKHFTFSVPDSTTMQVFWCLWDDVYDGLGESRVEVEDDKITWLQAFGGRARVAKFMSAFKRRRSYKRKVLLLGFREEDSERAVVKAKELVRGLVTVEKNGEVVRF